MRDISTLLKEIKKNVEKLNHRNSIQQNLGLWEDELVILVYAEIHIWLKQVCMIVDEQEHSHYLRDLMKRFTLL